MTETDAVSTAAESIVSCLIIEHGVTAVDPFERAYKLYAAKEAAEVLVKELNTAYINTIAPLIDAGTLTSQDRTYRLEEVTKSVTTVDKIRLLRNEPEFYEKIARVSPAVFVNELGHTYLRNILIEKIGIDKVHAYESISIHDFNAGFLDKETAADYRRASSHVVEYRMVKTSPEVVP